MLHYVKSDLVGSISGMELIDIRHKDMANQLSDDLVAIGDKTRKQLTKLKRMLNIVFCLVFKMYTQQSLAICFTTFRCQTDVTTHR